MWTPNASLSDALPMEQLHQKITERGLVVIENVTRVPVYGKPFSSPNLIVALCHRGWLHADYDTRSMEFGMRQASVLFPSHTLLVHDSSSDFLATLIVVSPEAFAKMRQRSAYRHQLAYQRQPSFQLDEPQYRSVQEAFGLIRSISILDAPQRSSMLANLIDVLSVLMDTYRFPNGDEDESPKTAGEQLFTRYYDLIVRYHAKTREVHFYASQFNLSPKYFSTLIKRETGVAAGDWISNYIVIQAKSLLRNRPDLNIQQVGATLGFHDQAAFSRYFKVNSGMCPKAYRDKWT